MSDLVGNGNIHCPIRPPQTAIGRTAGTLLGSAPVPVAAFAVAPWKGWRAAPSACPRFPVPGGQAAQTFRWPKTGKRQRGHRSAMSLPKRQGAGALQDASRGSVVIGERASVLECGRPRPLFHRARNPCAISNTLCPVHPPQTAFGGGWGFANGFPPPAVPGYKCASKFFARRIHTRSRLRW